MMGHHQWEKLVAIAERDFARIEAAADLHARAARELERVNDTLIDLLAKHAPSNVLAAPQRDATPPPATAAAPLAA